MPVKGTPTILPGNGELIGGYVPAASMNLGPPCPAVALRAAHFTARCLLPPPSFDLSARDGRPLAVFFEQLRCLECDTVHQKVLVQPIVRS